MKQSQQSLSGAYGAGLLCLHSLGGQVPPVFLEWAATKSISLLVRSMSLASKHVTHLQRRCYHTKISQRYFLSLPTELRGLKEADGLVVRSTSSDPYTNLSIENYLLTHSRPESRVYFFYINRPSVVIGRNQNPWLEANLQAFQSMGTSTTVELVRRRSGGGTVFHDHGNLNYCAIMPPKLFTRNLHAQVLANALNKESPLLRVRRFHVNERHDVVYDSCGTEVKVSGSAYKLVKGRALHHGTCLVGSDLTTIGQYLKSPTRSYISAKGVESTRTKVDNVIDWTKNDGADLKDGHGSNVSVSNLMERIISKFIKETARTIPGEENALKNMKILEIDGYARQPPKEQIVPTPFRLVYSADPPEVVDEIESGANELRSSSWKFLQTPRFTFTSHPESSSPDSSHAPFPKESAITLHVKSGAIDAYEGTCVLPDVHLTGRILHEIDDWRHLIKDDDGVATWLNQVLLVPAAARGLE